ncbi:hypothetical protein [Mesonia maritima]|uniref:Neutral ceramidase superfamily lipid hydrolase n=1 Tax=Mesonia maritima TaxID=1793873 RepID=A0ABU1K7G3_9FLAO|nr:hypothetical protein [Mesonia maritima]MDR6301561.1 putative neutral ceramidase superfamily lipid hydrolase [Mesonia maritima]
MKKILFQPFENYSEKKLLLVGILGTVLGSLIAYLFQARFDGILDVHFVENLEWYYPFLDNSINVISLSLLLFICGKIVNKKTRLIDIFNASLIARFPYYLISFANINGYMGSLSQRLLNFATEKPELLAIEGTDLIVILIFAFISLILLIYYLYLLYKGYQVATNAKGALAIILFILAVLFAEVISKYIIYLIYY